ncbi:GntR family transcriptional regulator [Sphingomonas sp. MG17]|uniref:GntR family transcriptional regulator n=1 Tax=Sphingomonas tagetis TaxID=2949092 RepID=A0A9X2HJP7_9SPHN|nr:GntR family transcriptional regulator [Sphingomonas tagetis]MCP3732113.1 GntR family transcriptional regulator [Sphingomonas tagetis]
MQRFSKRLPLWHQIAALLRSEILSGGRGPGDSVQPELELARQFGVSVIPVRQALRVLEEEELIVRQRGRGTFVSEAARGRQQVVTPIQQLFTAEFEKRAQVLERGIVSTPPSLQTVFSNQVELAFVKRLAFQDGRPWVYGTLYFDKEYAAAVTTPLLRRFPLYRILDEQCGLRSTRSHFDVMATGASSDCAQHLGIDPLASVLSLNSVTYDAHGRAIGAFNLYFHGDSFVFRFDMPHDD